MLSDLDPEFVPTLVCIRDRVRMSPVAMGLVVGIGAYWLRRSLLGDSRLHAFLSGAVMGASVATGMTATALVRLEEPDPVRERIASLH